MRYRHPLKQVLFKTVSHWDRDQTPPRVRWVFGKALQCQTAELGAEVYVGNDGELVVYHTCKSRACPSCGYRANIQWLRERWAALPDGSYKGITFTMPDVLWPIFRNNPHLANAFPVLDSLRCGTAVPRTFVRHRTMTGVDVVLGSIANSPSVPGLGQSV